MQTRSIGTRIYGVVIGLALVAVAISWLGVDALQTYRAKTAEMQHAARRGMIGQEVNGLIYAVVMDSRGVYMAREPNEREKYAKPLLATLARMPALMDEWQKLLAPGHQHDLDAALQNVGRFVEFRTETVRLAREVGTDTAREYGDNDLNRGNRQALGNAVSQLAVANESDLSRLDTELAGLFRARLIQLVAIAGGGILLALGAAIVVVRRSVTGPLGRMTGAMRQLADGDLAAEIPCLDRRDEIGAMAATVQVFKDNALHAKALEREQAEAQARRAAEDQRVRSEAEQAAAAEAAALVVGSIGAGLERLAAGDLSRRLEETLPGAYEKLRVDLNGAMEQLHTMIHGIVSNTSNIRSGTTEIAQAADDLSQRTERQAASLEETAAALDQITSTVRKTAEGAEKAHEVASKTRSDAEHSGQVVRDAVTAMGEIERSSQQIGQIISVIDDIAFQTNLLALNAGVEAARAGDAGRGFAVVASEVRALAQRSAEAAREIKTLISTSSQQVGSGVKLVADTGQALTRIVAQIAEVDNAVGEIARSAQEQATGLVEVNSAVNQMDQVTQQNAAMVEESTAAAHSLTQETEELARLTAHFRLAEAAEPASASASVRRRAGRRA